MSLDDDDFFSIDDFNRQTAEMEAKRKSSGRLSGDDDDSAPVTWKENKRNRKRSRMQYKQYQYQYQDG